MIEIANNKNGGREVKHQELRKKIQPYCTRET